MPAQSPTLSPTLSAITAGLRGSSSGIPASIFPTRSAPTSAAFVKIPPPSRAKTEISEPPKPSPTRASTAFLSLRSVKISSAPEYPADCEPDRSLDVLERDQQDRDHHADSRDDRVLALEVSARALLDGARDL